MKNLEIFYKRLCIPLALRSGKSTMFPKYILQAFMIQYYCVCDSLRATNLFDLPCIQAIQEASTNVCWQHNVWPLLNRSEKNFTSMPDAWIQ